MSLNAKQQKTLKAIFADPVRSNILRADIERLLAALGAEVGAGSGSRIRFALHGVRAVFHRPHPKKETDKGSLKSMRRFFTEAGVAP